MIELELEALEAQQDYERSMFMTSWGTLSWIFWSVLVLVIFHNLLAIGVAILLPIAYYVLGRQAWKPQGLFALMVLHGLFSIPVMIPVLLADREWKKRTHTPTAKLTT